MSERPDNPSGETAARETKVERELDEVLEELHAVRRELESRDRRIDELARAYSALLNEQKEFRGRLEREKDRVLESERGKIALYLLQFGDEIERALGAAHGDEGPLAQGVRLIHEGLNRTLTSMGIERLALVGRPFDPNLAEVLDVQPVSEPARDGEVLSELAPGYRLGERLLRAARVRVARYMPAQPAAGPAAGDGASAPDGESVH